MKALLLRKLALGSVLAAVAAGLFAVPVDAAAVEVRPRVIPLSAREIPNSLRGQYQWMSGAVRPKGWPVRDLYYRDQVAWSRIEPTQGSYDFSWFDSGLRDASRRGGRFGFRVMAYCPGCWLDATPTWLPRQPGRSTPDWNDPAFLAAWERLMSTLGARYGTDPRLGWVDVGGYGDYGEWHATSGGTRITQANAERVVRAVLNAFPTTHVVINAADADLVHHALSLTPRLGLRVDCLGERQMFSNLPSSPIMRVRWRTAPVVSEWCRTPTTSMVRGARQVRRYHVSLVSSASYLTPYAQLSAKQKSAFQRASKRAGYRYAMVKARYKPQVRSGGSLRLRVRWHNAGSAATYDEWRVQAVLMRKGRARATTDLGWDLRRLRPGAKTFGRRFTLPALPRGSYTLAIVVRDPRGYLAPMRLANEGRTKGRYSLGKVAIR